MAFPVHANNIAVLSHFTRTLDDASAERFVAKLLQLAAKEHIDSAGFAMALADALAITAATLDRDVDVQSLTDRLGAFCQRVETKYVQVLATMERHDWDANPKVHG